MNPSPTKDARNNLPYPPRPTTPPAAQDRSQTSFRRNDPSSPCSTTARKFRHAPTIFFRISSPMNRTDVLERNGLDGSCHHAGQAWGAASPQHEGIGCHYEAVLDSPRPLRRAACFQGAAVSSGVFGMRKCGKGGGCRPRIRLPARPAHGFHRIAHYDFGCFRNVIPEHDFSLAGVHFKIAQPNPAPPGHALVDPNGRTAMRMMHGKGGIFGPILALGIPDGNLIAA